MYKYVMLGMMTQAAIGGTLSYLGMIKLSTGQQLGAAVFFLVFVVIAHLRAS